MLDLRYTVQRGLRATQIEGGITRGLKNDRVPGQVVPFALVAALFASWLSVDKIDGGLQLLLKNSAGTAESFHGRNDL